MNIFSIPFAGGSVYSLKPFEIYMNEGVRWIPLEPPGRGRRIREPLIKDLHQMAADIFNQIRSGLNEPYAFYGHSMGAMLAYLVTRMALDADLPPPARLFLSGCGAPASKSKLPGRHKLPKNEFWSALKDLGGSPDEILQNEELQHYFEPILRADFEAIEKYNYEETTPFDIPVTVIIGYDEFVTREEAEQWQMETVAPIDVISYPGNHFFIFDRAFDIARLIKQTLNV
ncbi:thioesterase II family protein [Chitinophaga pinensis]|uniref:Thioesterase n=1 Tax=Chitinophaga pinensis TaxID=79329 RepID=A0A5C6LJI9_9BACT|nr:alpha/beta fold hydrolase [Chitinophaga pinensis]TWV91494.1 thioesterase [Chitinophaga pinensis]